MTSEVKTVLAAESKPQLDEVREFICLLYTSPSPRDS